MQEYFGEDQAASSNIMHSSSGGRCGLDNGDTGELLPTMVVECERVEGSTASDRNQISKIDIA